MHLYKPWHFLLFALSSYSILLSIWNLEESLTLPYCLHLLAILGSLPNIQIEALFCSTRYPCRIPFSLVQLSVQLVYNDNRILGDCKKCEWIWFVKRLSFVFWDTFAISHCGSHSHCCLCLLPSVVFRRLGQTKQRSRHNQWLTNSVADGA